VTSLRKFSTGRDVLVPFVATSNASDVRIPAAYAARLAHWAAGEGIEPDSQVAVTCFAGGDTVETGPDACPPLSSYDLRHGWAFEIITPRTVIHTVELFDGGVICHHRKTAIVPPLANAELLYEGDLLARIAEKVQFIRKIDLARRAAVQEARAKDIAVEAIATAAKLSVGEVLEILQYTPVVRSTGSSPEAEHLEEEWRQEYVENESYFTGYAVGRLHEALVRANRPAHIGHSTLMQLCDFALTYAMQQRRSKPQTDAELWSELRDQMYLPELETPPEDTPG
jgi:hypothetical protein